MKIILTINEARAIVGAKYGVAPELVDIATGGDLLTKDEKDLAKTDFIAVIKSLRARTGCGLKEAKEIVDTYRASIGK